MDKYQRARKVRSFSNDLFEDYESGNIIFVDKVEYRMKSGETIYISAHNRGSTNRTVVISDDEKEISIQAHISPKTSSNNKNRKSIDGLLKNKKIKIASLKLIN